MKAGWGRGEAFGSKSSEGRGADLQTAPGTRPRAFSQSSIHLLTQRRRRDDAERAVCEAAERTIGRVGRR